MAEPVKNKKKPTFTPVFRVSFPHVFTPQQPGADAAPGTKPKYGVMAVFNPKEFSPEDAARWKEISKLANDASMKKFGEPLSALPPNYKRPFRRGDEKREYGFTADQIFISLTSLVKPGIVASDGITKITDAEGFYPGCYARATVGAFAYKKGGGMGVAIGLNNLMFVKDGPRLDNRVAAEEEFEDFADPNAAAEDLSDADLGL